MTVAPMPTEHPKVAASYNNLGNVHCRQGKLEDAMEAHDEAGLRKAVLSFQKPAAK